MPASRHLGDALTGSPGLVFAIRSLSMCWMCDLAADYLAWWRWAFGQNAHHLQIISPTVARWYWAQVVNAVRFLANLH